MYYIWIKRNDCSGAFVSQGYKYKQNAVRAAKRDYGNEKFTWLVSKENPWI